MLNNDNDFEKSAPTRGRTLDYAAYVYDYISPLMTFGYENKIGQKVISLLDIKGNEQVLDLGCGTGTLTIEAGKQLSKGGRIVGIDAASKMIKVARKKVINIPNVSFDVCAAERLIYLDNSFDCAISTFFFHHIDIDLKIATLNEIWRILKIGGKAVIVDVDIPYSLFGKICAWSGYLLFQQNQIKENIRGKLRDAISLSSFEGFKIIRSDMGYITTFYLQKRANELH